MLLPNTARLTEIAESTRKDFESGSISNEDIVEAGELYHPNDTGYWADLLSTIRLNFPHLSCDFAASILRRRVGFGEVTQGSYDGYIHTVLNVGETALGNETIVDITSDQFRGPKIYVGPLLRPWAKDQTWHWHDHRRA